MTPEELDTFENEIEPALKNSRMSKETQQKMVDIYNRVFAAKKRPTSCWSCITNTAHKLRVIHDETCIRAQQPS